MIDHEAPPSSDNINCSLTLPATKRFLIATEKAEINCPKFLIKLHRVERAGRPADGADQ